MLKIKFDLFNYPNSSFITYQLLGNLLVLIITNVYALTTSSNFFPLYFGYFLGSVATIIGFYIITVHATRVVRNINTEKAAKISSYMFLILRIVIYALIAIFAISIVNVNVITLFLGFFSIKIVIYVDHFVNK